MKQCKIADTEEELLEGFKIFDLDGNGFISPEEFQTVTRGLGEVRPETRKAPFDQRNGVFTLEIGS